MTRWERLGLFMFAIFAPLAIVYLLIAGPGKP